MLIFQPFKVAGALSLPTFLNGSVLLCQTCSKVSGDSEDWIFLYMVAIIMFMSFTQVFCYFDC